MNNDKDMLQLGMETKECSKCQDVHPNTSEYFYFKHKTSGFLRSQCKNCSDEWQKQYILDKSDLVRAYKRKSYLKSKGIKEEDVHIKENISCCHTCLEVYQDKETCTKCGSETIKVKWKI